MTIIASFSCPCGHEWPESQDHLAVSQCVNCGQAAFPVDENFDNVPRLGNCDDLEDHDARRIPEGLEPEDFDE